MSERYGGSLLYQVVKGDLHFPTLHEERVVKLSGGVDQIVRLNPRRLTLVIVNRSMSPVDVAFRPGTLPGGGIMIGANGGSLTLTWLEDGELVGSEVYATGVSGATVYVLEVIATAEGGAS
jgi:hypothetical protein